MQHPAITQYKYHQWANDRIFGRLLELPDEVYDQSIKSVFNSIQEVLAHIYQTDGMWLSVMSGDDFAQTVETLKQIKEKCDNKSLTQIDDLYKAMNTQYLDFLNKQDDLDRELTIKPPKYGPLEISVTEMVKHVVNHGTYHRGNITAMLRQQGHAGVPTDYIFYLYDR
ncbi:DinB family protein [Gracilimonas mengyeensis]|uniref:Uncharacterized damage-inducible protein DinB (Forms a four-helix bundle) n=1 Tax=Gracilimonas mengyeensis TaxID=1302730 RepID=A0A521FCL5_9BACT|nr:DinB family protein [Gracilimonas mengyeensis]SMO93932.1 Uncharacterized damage-inducible protein DinB (forms a four-helix bundle) [Gracilimonas mengyeensis]